MRMKSEKKVNLVSDMVASLEFSFSEKVLLISRFLQQEPNRDDVLSFVKITVKEQGMSFDEVFPQEAQLLREIRAYLASQKELSTQLLDRTALSDPAKKEEDKPRTKRPYHRKNKGENKDEKNVKQKRPYHRRNVAPQVSGSEGGAAAKSDVQKAEEAFDADVKNGEDASSSSPKGRPPEKEDKILPLDLLYPFNVRSRKIIEGKKILGVVVPYVRGGGTFALSLDEVAEMLPLKEALVCARKYPRINGALWEVLSGFQLQSCEACKKSLNEVLKAVGGDLFKDDYLTNPPEGGWLSKQYKVRFAIDVR